MVSRQVALLVNGPLIDQLSELLISAGWAIFATSEAAIAPALNRPHPFHAGIILLENGSRSEIDRMEELTAGVSDIECIALVAPQLLSNKSVCKLLKTRFYDFHSLPVDPLRLLWSLGHAHGKGQLADLDDDLQEPSRQYGMIGSSKVMRDLYIAIDKASGTDAPVLISGESGTGKELIARAIHKHSSRMNAPFVAVNCAALPANLIQSELFGYEKGAFTGALQTKVGRIETAAGGTLFLDEIGDLPSDLQVNLLRVLQDQVLERLGSNREIRLDIRIMAASHVDLETAMQLGRFREDLYYRLNVLRLKSPALRERGGDVELLAKHYLDKFSKESRSAPQGFSDQALNAMNSYSWPGNVRELINRVRQATIMGEKRLLTLTDLGLEKRVTNRSIMTLEQARIHAEHEVIRHTLRHNQNNVSATARQLGVSRATLYRLLERSSFMSGKNSIGQTA